MKAKPSLLALLSMSDSILILVLLAGLAIPPHPLVLLPWAGALAGLNAVLFSYFLEGLDPWIQAGLRWVGLGAAILLAILALVKMAG